MQQMDNYLRYGGNTTEKLQYLKKVHTILDMLSILKAQLNPSISIIEKLLKFVVIANGISCYLIHYSLAGKDILLAQY